MGSIPLYALSPKQVYEMLEASPSGLQDGEVSARRTLYGFNVLTTPPQTPAWKRWMAYTTHPMALLLWLAGIVLLFTGHASLGVIIILVVFINATFSFWREYRATRAIEALNRLLPVFSRLVRAGKETRIPASDIVPGDLLILAEGDNIPADARIVEEFGLRVNNAVLTGETMPARKTAEASNREGMTEIERPNLVFAGTSVISGTGKAVVFSTGMLTQFGRIANMTQAVKEAPSFLQQQMARISRLITIIAIVVGFIVFSVGLFDLKTPMEDSLILAIGIIVAVVPEGLVSTVTLTLAMAVQRLALKKVLVKKLASVETLGTVSVICTDKSGTLTQNQMTIRQIWVGNEQFHISGVGYEPEGDIKLDKGCSECHPDDLSTFYRAALLCNNSRLIAPGDGQTQWTSLGDQTEAALLAMAMKSHIDVDQTINQFQRFHEIPFDARRKRMSTIHRLDDGEIAYVKGAPKEVLQLCTHIFLEGQVVPLDNNIRSRIMAANDDYARGALRVLALAQRQLPPRKGIYSVESVETNLTFLGLAGMMDPPRPEVAEAMASFRKAGIRVAMITGDYGLTAESIARRIGMLSTTHPKILTGIELDELDEDKLNAVLDEEIIFARMAPEHKLRLVEAFQKKGEVVAVIGDGVNDTPALRKADIGIAMGITGTDVAKEAADIILAQDDFSAVVKAIEEGRAAYDNLRKFVTYIFASNVPEILPFILTAMFHIPLALTVAQILAIDLGTDLLPALALGTEKPEWDVMLRPPRRRDLPLLDNNLAWRAFGWLGSLEAFLCYLGFFWVYDNIIIRDFLGNILPTLPYAIFFPAISPENTYLLATTVFHAGVVTTQVGNVFACRSEKSYAHQLGWLSNPLVIVGVAVEIILIIIMVYVPQVAGALNHYPIPPVFWIGLGLYAPAIYSFERMRKMFNRRSKANI
jgi:P-type Ca2+ transporter type 2C